MIDILLILFALFTKHLIVDFPLQKPYQFLNKHIYGHPGGLLHAGLHALGTLIALWLVTNQFFLPLGVILLVAAADGAVHYHVDWAKMNLNKRLGWAPATHEEFWWLLGLDQYLHALTYLGIALYLR
jgi:hypothetical protein